MVVINCRGKLLDLSSRTHIMGVINCTPDSFFAGSRMETAEKAIQQGIRMASSGADILDVGGESTRPGSEPVSAEEELQRVLPVVEALLEKVDIPISIDTYKADVARQVLKLGAHIVNDISGFTFEPEMVRVAAEYDIPAILMHIKGRPRDMQTAPHYDDVVDEIKSYFAERIAFSQENGLSPDRIVLDPGIGFGKRLDDNYEILARLHEFTGLGRPLLLGPSRKSFIGRVLEVPVEESLSGTIAAVTACILNGAHIVRVHDVRAAKEAAIVADRVLSVRRNRGAEWTTS